MKKLGVAVFSGMEQSVGLNIKYLKLARSLHYEKLFTSMHIPEVDYRTFLSDFRRVLDEALNLGFEVTVDVAPHSWAMLGINPEDLRNWGIYAIRTDYGFSTDRIQEMAVESGLRIEINASCITEAELSQLLSAGLDHNMLCAGHNYYPRPDTGLSFELFIRRSQFFKILGIPVSAFIPGKQHPRGPVYSGLPTVEDHRRMNAVEAARQFWASRLVDTIIFGDPLVSGEELAAVAALPQEVPDTLTLRVALNNFSAETYPIIMAPRHTNRIDASGYVVRSQESRTLCSGTIAPQSCHQPRRRGDLTIDNCKYGRYAGELQIILQDLVYDERVNVIGRVIDEDLCLLDCILPGQTFCFKETQVNEF